MDPTSTTPIVSTTTTSADGGGDADPISLSIVGSFSLLCIVLLIGHYIRVKLWWLRMIYIPSSLLGGMVGLLILQLSALHPSTERFVSQEIAGGWSELPNFLINLVFACLFLGEKIPNIGKVWQVSGPQLMYGQILAWGQYAIPALVTVTLLIPTMGVNELIAPVVALGFEGGHGTAAGVKQTFTTLGYEVGGDLSLFAATIGLVGGVIIGTILVNWAVRKGIVKSMNTNINHITFTGMFDVDKRPSAGVQTVSMDALESLALHMGVVGLTMWIAFVIKRLLIYGEGYSSWLSEYRFFSAFPTFPFCMLGGIIVQLVLDKVSSTSPIDRTTIERISGLSLEFTIVAAVATMKFSGLESSLAPFFILVAITIIWHLVCFFFIAPRVLPDYWVQRAIAELGQSMGVTSTGLLLLRMTDPSNETTALAAFSYKQLLHEPIVGGGLWTASVLPFISAVGLWPVVGVSWGALLFWTVVYYFYFRKKYNTKYNGIYGRSAYNEQQIEDDRSQMFVIEDDIEDGNIVIESTPLLSSIK
eukprot:m.108533 g.108533  ORF g.108533 m.108533 type:complete len:531 (-) comp9191_c1_seq6:4399-5991(-)